MISGFSEKQIAWSDNIRHFPGQCLYVTEEILEETTTDPLLKKYDQYLTMENEFLDGTEDDWSGEQYEKATLPKGVDRAFKGFSERVAEWSDQCVR